ncbi:hypothetical protein PSTT_12071 [Puccinia striiformis]|uniref:Peptidase A2 domain-containing protein n=1 Tax=Puccinia striiformis TaxID=27350 RepID=A0A2S4UXT7_9BASI|nr:hypothetical protein PSTT_12071 [Puccinia striiformis]
MTTRNSNTPLLPTTDPEQIIRSANAEKRRLAQLANHSNSKNSITFPTPSNSISLMSSDTPTPGKATTPTDPLHNGPTSLVPASTMSTEDMLRAFIQVQHTSAIQSASRLERLEEAVFAMSIKTENREPSAAPEPGRIDLQRFKTTDGPLYTGPFRSVEPFITWLNGIQFFFATKAVAHPVDKIRVAGCLIRESNTLTFYANNVESLVLGSWDKFKTALFDFALPPLWCTNLRTQVRYLKIHDSELFFTFSTRARTLQNMVNFDATTSSKVSDFDIAESVFLGLPIEVQNLITNHQLLLVSPFEYNTFESVSGFQERLQKLRGLELPANYKPPMPQGPSSAPPAGRATQPLAGRPRNCLALVAGIAEQADDLSIGTAAVQAMAMLDEELRLTNEAGYVPAPTAPRLIIEFLANGSRVRALIDSGSQLNLITEAAAARASLTSSRLNWARTGQRLGGSNHSPSFHRCLLGRPGFAGNL